MQAHIALLMYEYTHVSLTAVCTTHMATIYELYPWWRLGHHRFPSYLQSQCCDGDRQDEVLTQ